MQELKIRKPGARGRRRRSKREAFEEELREETPPPDDYMELREDYMDYMEEGEEATEFGFVESEDKETKDFFLFF